MTTITYEGAAALYIVAHEILFKDASFEVVVTIPCAGGATLILERKPGQNGQLETFLVVTKNNEHIAFKFNTRQYKYLSKGQMVTEVLEMGLGVFYKTLDGYLSGINADGHLNKLGDDLEAFQEEWQHTKEQQSSNAAGSNPQGNTGQFGNNITYQVQANNNQSYANNQYAR